MKWKKQEKGDIVTFSFGGDRNRHLWKQFEAHYYSVVIDCGSIDCRIKIINSHLGIGVSILLFVQLT